MDWGKWVLGYFNLSFRERIGVLVLAFLILFCFFLPRIVAGPASAAISTDTTWIRKLRELELKQEKEEKVHFRSQKENLATYQYDRIADYTRHDRPKFTDTLRHYSTSSKRSAPAVIPDINTADTSAFIALPGIGSKLANRIINFRKKLGGFYRVQQIAEVYGLVDSVFQNILPYLQLKDSAVRKININIATADELKAHPYIKYDIAKAILSYRQTHGPFDKIEDVKKLMIVDDNWYNKILPYLTTE